MSTVRSMNEMHLLAGPSAQVMRSGWMWFRAILMALPPFAVRAQQAAPQCSSSMTIGGNLRLSRASFPT